MAGLGPRPRHARRFSAADEGVSEVLGSVILVALTVVMMGAFGGVVFSTVTSETPTPPASSFTLRPDLGQNIVNVTMVSGSTIALEGATLKLLVNGADRTVSTSVVDARLAGRWSVGETLQITLSGAALAPGDAFLFLAADNASGKPIGTAYATISTSAGATVILQNVLTPTLSFDPPTLVTNGRMLTTANVAVRSSMGLLLVDRVELDLDPVGGDRVTLYDDGRSPDLIAGDGNFTTSFFVSNYTYDRFPGTASVAIPATVYDVLGHWASVSLPALLLEEPAPSKVGAGVVYREIGSSEKIDTAGYVNLSAFVLRDAASPASIDNDEIELRVSDLSGTSYVWSALVRFANTADCGPAVTEVVLRVVNGPHVGDVTYEPEAGSCFAVGPNATLNLANLGASRDDDGDVDGWDLAGGDTANASWYQYAEAGITDNNEALIAFFGDVVSIAPADRGLSQTDFEWAPPLVTSLTAPAGILDLAATPGNGVVDLAWSEPDDGGSAITGYKIYRNGVLVATIPPGTTYQATGLTNGVAYTFTVRAVNAIGDAAASNAVVATPVSVPGAPAISTSAPGNRSVSLAWTLPSSGGSAITTYHVYAGTTSGATTYVGSTGGTNRSYVVNNLPNGQLHYFNVSAANAQGNGTSSAQVSATPSTIPNPPASFGATAGAARVTLSWSLPDDGGSPLTNFHVYRGLAPGLTTLLASTGSGANTSFVDLTAANGVAYYYNVTARNANGVSASTATDSATPSAILTAPTAPESLAATRGNQSALLSWSAPSSDGGSAITHYRIYVGTASGGQTYLASNGGTNLTFTVNGLANGVPYFFNVTAVNAIGEGPTSPEATATPAGVPYPPFALSAARGNGTASLSWSAPANTGGLPVTSYNVYVGASSGNTAFVASTASPGYVVTGLTNGNAYFVNVTAVSAAGQSAGSNEATVVPATVPNPPASPSAAAGNGQVTLSWTPPANGGSSITNYKVYGGATSGATSFLAFAGSGSNTSFAVSGLPNGVPYFLNVTAVNDVGESATSVQVSATPGAVPSAPQSLAAARGNQSVSLSWAAPASNGGFPVTIYHVYRGTSSGATSWIASTASTSYLATGLANGQPYVFNVTAQNAIGQGASSGEASATPSTTPNPPTALSATRGNAQVSLAWSAPADNGGSAITGYDVYRGTGTGATSYLTTVATTSYVATGLTNGQPYFFNVTARNANGASSTSPEATATPATTPGAPQSLTATKGNAQVTLSWSAPASSGGTTITGYKIYRGNASGATSYLATTASTGYVATGLTNGQPYFFNVTAVNAVGEGPTSAEASAVPSTVPGAPTGLGATRGNGTVSLAWTAPASNGGSAITGYHVYRGTSTGGASYLATTGTTPAYTDNAVSNGVTYYYNVTAANANGQGASSGEANALPAGVPYPPATFTATAGLNQVALSWTAGATGGSGITGYQIWRGTSTGSLSQLATTGTNLTFADANVAAGTTYYYAVRAVNAVGTGNPGVERSATPTGGTPPGAPTSLVASPANGQVGLNWTAPTSTGSSSLTGYKIYRNGVLLATTGTNLTFIDRAVTNGVGYTYYVVAYSAAGDGAASNSVSATPNAAVSFDCSSLSASAGSVDSCTSIQFADLVYGTLDESGGGSAKTISMTFSMNLTGVAGTQTLELNGYNSKNGEDLLLQARASNGTYMTIATLPGTTSGAATVSGTVDAATYWPSGVLAIRIIDAGADPASTTWKVDFVRMVTT